MHLPVLLEEAIKLLDPRHGDFIIDGTFGQGGHSGFILKKINPGGRLLALDWNEKAFNKCNEFKGLDSEGGSNGSDDLQSEIICANRNFSDLKELLSEMNLPKVNGLLLDLGFSSDELESSGRGFSFQKNEPLIMTYNDGQVPLKELLKELKEEELAQIIREYSGEKFFERIAREIKDYQRKKNIETSGELSKIIINALPKGYERGRIHPATRTFMALRIYVNQEILNLKKLLEDINQILLPAGKLVIISFQSLEDRIVKQYFRSFMIPINKKPITPSFEEIVKNPRSRSAKLRGATLITND